MTNTFYCINCKKEIGYVDTGNAAKDITDGYNKHQENCYDLTANLTMEESMNLFADRIIEIAREEERKKKNERS